MQLRLHANATTTPRTRAYIQQSTASPAALARELGIHPRTVARWKARPDVADRSTRPHRLATPITAWEEALIVELPHGSSPWAEGPRSLALPLDDIVEATTAPSSPTASPSTRKPNPTSGPPASTRSTAPAPRTPSPTASLSLSGRKPTAWSSASTAALASISTACRKTAPPTTAAFSTMPNATPTSSPSSPGHNTRFARPIVKKQRWDQEFESRLLQRGVYLGSAARGCRRKAPHFGGGLRVAGDVRRNAQAANRDSFALLSDRH